MNTNVIEGNPTKKFFIEMITCIFRSIPVHFPAVY